MTERELFAYREALNEYKRACEDLQEFETTMLSPHSVHISDMPKDKETTIPDKLSSKIDIHQKLLCRRDKAGQKMANARELLYRVEDMLDKEAERSFLWHRYVKGLDIKEIQAKTYRSRSALMYDRANILTRIKDVKP